MAVARRKRASPKMKIIPKKNVLAALTKAGNPKGTASPKKITSYMKSVMTVEHYPGRKEQRIKRAVRNALKKGCLNSKRSALRGLSKEIVGLKRRMCRTSRKRNRRHEKRRPRHLIVVRKSRKNPRVPYGHRNLAIRHLHNHPFRKR